MIDFVAEIVQFVEEYCLSGQMKPKRQMLNIET